MGKTPISIVIFGITGDLARSKLVPSLFDLYCKGELKGDVSIIGYGRKQFSAEEFDAFVSESIIGKNPGTEISALRQRQRFISMSSYVQGELEDTGGYSRLRKRIGRGKRTLYFLSVHPELHELIIPQLGKESLLNSKSQIMIEKPFGHDVKTALALDRKLCRYVNEDQIYRIDHYLGKSSLIELIERRKNDKTFENALESDVKEIHVSLLEKKTIGTRGAFYDNVGALKDVGQNHLLQMLAAVIAPKEISCKDSEEVQKARAAALSSLRLRMPAARAQYQTYRNEPGIAPHSQTETFFTVAAQSAIPGFKKTLIAITAGKALSESKAEIKIIFNKPIGEEGNASIFSLNKESNDRHSSPKGKKPMEAYERIFLAAIQNDRRFFSSIEEVIAGWKFDAGVRKFWKKRKIPLKKYEIGDSIHIPKKGRA